MTSWYVGGEALPLATQGSNVALRDPTLVGLLDYLGFWLQTTLNSRLSELQGPEDSSVISDACPAAHRFPWDHSGTFARSQRVDAEGTMAVPLPGLWAWVTSEVEGDEGASLLCEGTLSRTVRVDYIFPELQLPDGFNARSGLMSSVGRTFALALQQQRHADYAYRDSAPGTSILESLRLLGARFVSGRAVALTARPSTSVAGNAGRSRSEGAVQRFFPTYEATLQVFERIDPRAVVLPDDRFWVGNLTIAQGDDANDALDVLERVLMPVPDDG